MKYLLPHKQITLVFLILVSFLAQTLTLAASEGNKFVDPEKFADWEVVGPDGGDVRAIAVDPRDKTRLYITTGDGQIHSSADSGKSWRLLVNLNQPQLTLDQLIVDSEDSSKIYTSGHRGKRAGGFFYTKDGGNTWKESKDLRAESIHAMTQAKDDPKTLFVGTETGVFQSKNSGEDWSRVADTTTITSGGTQVTVNSIEVDPLKSSTIYAGTSWRPYKSTDSGKSWRLIKAGIIDDSDVFAITVNPKDRSHIIASACSGIYESLNGGEQWKKIQGIPSTSRRTRAIVQHPSVPGTVYAGTTEGFWMSVNGGKSWSMTTQRNLEINSIAVHPDEPNRVYIATNNFGVMISNDGGRNFAQSNTSFTSRLTYAVVADKTQPNRLYATTQNTAAGGGFVFFSGDAGRSWTQSKGIDVNRVSPFAILQDRTTPEKLYMGTNLGIFRSLDRGVSWALMAPPKAPAKKRAPVKKAVATKGKAVAAKPAVKKATVPAADAGPVLIPTINEKVKFLSYTEDGKDGIFAGTDNGLYRSYDLAKGWEKLSFGDNLNANVFVVHTTPLIPGTIWVGTASSGLIVSNDDGKTWTKTNASPDNVPVSSFVSDPKRPNYLYLGTIQAFYVSRDGGRTWNRRGGNLPLGNFTAILVNPNNTDEIFVSSAIETDGGVFYSEDAGQRWKRIDGKDMKIPSRRLWSMVQDPHDPNRMFAGSHSSGVYIIERHQQSAKAQP
jgi:photosystem II stability/assembly factor-like uncharacterized protein